MSLPARIAPENERFNSSLLRILSSWRITVNGLDGAGWGVLPLLGGKVSYAFVILPSAGRDLAEQHLSRQISRISYMGD